MMISPQAKRVGCAALLGAALLAGGCATGGKPRPVEDARWLQDSFSRTRGDLAVWIAVPGEEQTAAHFGLPLQAAGVQPIWLRVANRSPRAWWLLPAFTDPDYFSSAEVACRFRETLDTAAGRRREEVRLEELTFDNYIPPGADQSGFLYTVLEEGSQVYSIALLSTGALERFDFLVPTRSLQLDYAHLTAAGTNAFPAGITDIANPAALRAVLETLPAHASDPSDQAAGDPINFFVVGPWETLVAGLISADWDETEILSAQTALRTTGAFVLGSEYRHSPVSPLYVFGRRHDAAFQKVRENLNARNHLRLWRLPLACAGRPVWAGQISRDIGVRFTTHTPWLTTHEIDPDVDGARWGLVQDLVRAQCLAEIGFVGGGETATPLAPLTNLTGDDYFTDGLRAVLFLSSSPVGADEIQVLPWAYPPRGGLSQPGDYLKLDPGGDKK